MSIEKPIVNKLSNRLKSFKISDLDKFNDFFNQAVNLCPSNNLDRFVCGFFNIALMFSRYGDVKDLYKDFSFFFKNLKI